MADDKRESGQPGGGVGRRDYVGGSGIWPAGVPHPSDAEPRTPGRMGRGAAGGAQEGGDGDGDAREE